MNFNCKIVAWLYLLPASMAFAADYFDETKTVALFAFDDVSIPFSQNLKLEMRQPVRHAANPVLNRGEAGTPDAHGVQFYGSIIKEDSKYRLWYVAFDDEASNTIASARWRAAYAESSDGVTWTKPHLDLVELHGNKNNNLLDMGDKWGFVNLKVIKDESDSDPERRYKMTTHVYFRHNTRLGTLLPFVSADGLTWKPVKEVKPLKAELRKEDLFIPGFHQEPCGGLYQWDGFYYLNSQNAVPGIHHYQGRVVRLFRSKDFINWSATNHIGFVRTPQHEYLGAGKSREGEQNHEGISVWNRGNLLLGIYGRWHGSVEWKDVSVDLGFVVSNDGLNFREPQNEWTFLKRGDDGQWDQGGLLQGQGFENIGEQTFVYYGAWDPRHSQNEPKRGGMGIAMLPRDRFGELMVDTSSTGLGDYQLPITTSEFITRTVQVKPDVGHRLYVNVDGLGSEAALKIELLDKSEKPLPGYSGSNAATIRQSGFQTPVEWSGKHEFRNLPELISIRVTIEGNRRTDIRFSALYVQSQLSATN